MTAGGGGGGGRSNDFIESEILAKRDFLGDAGIFLGRGKKGGFFGVATKGLRDFGGYAKKGSDFYWQTNSEVVISFGIKYKPLPPPPPPPPPFPCR